MKNTMKRVLAMLLTIIMVVVAFPVAMVSAEEPAPQADTLTYKDIVVKDGLQIWLDSYDAESSKIDLANGTWASEVGSAVATLAKGTGSNSTVSPWEADESGKGIGWSQVAHEGHTAVGPVSSGINLDPSLIPAEDWTLEIAAAVNGVTKADGSRFVNTTSTYGETMSDAIQVGIFRSTSWNSEATKQAGNNLGHRFFLTGLTYGSHSTSFGATKIGYQVRTDSGIYLNHGVDVPTVTSISYDRAADNKSIHIKIGYNNTLTCNGDVKVTNMKFDQTYLDNVGVIPANNAGWAINWIGYTTDGEANVIPVAPDKTGNADYVRFRVMYGLAGNVYSVRVYDRALSDAEKAQNYFADLAAYYDLDLSMLAALPENARYHVYNRCTSISFDDYTLDDAIVLQSIVNDYIDDYTIYDSLYVQDGLTLLLTAYNGASTVDLAAGKWYNKAGSSNATMVGTSYWSLKDNAVGYQFDSLSTLNNQKYNVGIYLPTDTIDNDGNLTTEMIFNATPVVDAEGNQVYIKNVQKTDSSSEDGLAWEKNTDGSYKTDANGDKIPVYVPSAGGTYGLYNGARSNFTLGGFQMCLFHPSEHKQGNYFRSRMFFWPVAWEARYKDVQPQSGANYTEAVLFGTNPLWDVSIRNMTITRAVTEDPSHPTWDNVAFVVKMDGVQMSSFSNGGKDLQKSYFTVDELNTLGAANGNTAFQAFFGLPANVYSIRAYTRFLTAPEANQNHFVDLCAYTGADLTEFLEMSDAVKGAIYAACSGLDFTATAEEIEGIIDEFKTISVTPTVYDNAYVQDGLVGLVSSFAGDHSSVDFENGTWYAKVGDSVAVLAGVKYDASTATQGWKMRDEATGAVGYDLASNQNGSGIGGAQYIDISGFGLDSLKDFTVEYVGALQGFTNNRAGGVYNTDVITEKFGHWGGWRYSASSGNNMRMLYSNNGLGNNYGHNGHTYTSDCHAFLWEEEAALYTYSNVIINAELDETRILYRNGATGMAGTIARVGSAAHNSIRVDTGGTTSRIRSAAGANCWFLMRNVSTTIHAIRMYDRALSTNEVNWNHFIDLAAYVNADISGLEGLTGAAKQQIADTFKGIRLDQVMVEDIEGYISMFEGETIDDSLTVYDSLYVQDGLTVLLNGFDASTVNGNLWYSKVGGAYATMVGDKWVADDASGVGYSLTYDEYRASGENYLNLGGANLPSHDYTVETVQIMKGLTNEDGSRYVDALTKEDGTAQNPWGVYTSSYGSWEIGAYKNCTFITRSSFGSAGSGQCAIRPIYRVGSGYWNNGNFWVGTEDTFFYNNEYFTTPVTVSLSAKASVVTRDINRVFNAGDADDKDANLIAGATYTSTGTGVQLTYTQNGSSADGSGYTDYGYDVNTYTSHIQVKYNRATGVYYHSGDATHEDGTVCSCSDAEKAVEGHNAMQGYVRYMAENQAYQANTPNSTFRIMQNMPGTLYAVRVYDRALSAAEKAQNHFVDIAAYYELDMTEFISLEDTAKANVYALFENMTFDADRTGNRATMAQSALDRAVASYRTGIVGYQIANDGTGIRVIGAIDNLEGVRLIGMEVTLGSKTLEGTTGVIYSSITGTAAGATEKTVYEAGALCTVNLFAARLKGVQVGDTLTIRTYTVDKEWNKTYDKTVTFTVANP